MQIVPAVARPGGFKPVLKVHHPASQPGEPSANDRLVSRRRQRRDLQIGKRGTGRHPRLHVEGLPRAIGRQLRVRQRVRARRSRQQAQRARRRFPIASRPECVRGSGDRSNIGFDRGGRRIVGPLRRRIDDRMTGVLVITAERSQPRRRRENRAAETGPGGSRQAKPAPRRAQGACARQRCRQGVSLRDGGVRSQKESEEQEFHVRGRASIAVLACQPKPLERRRLVELRPIFSMSRESPGRL